MDDLIKGGVTLNMRGFVPTQRKVEILAATIESSYHDGIVNPALLTFHFRVNMFLAWTSHEFTSEQLSDRLGLYDYLVESGLLPAFYIEMENEHPGEINDMLTLLGDWVEEFKTYERSFAGAVDNLIGMLTEYLGRTEEGLKVLQGLDVEQLNMISAIAKDYGVDLAKQKPKA